MGCSQPAAPAASSTPSPVAGSPAQTDFGQLAGDKVENLKGTPLGGTATAVTGLVGSKLNTPDGAFVPLLQTDKPEQVMLAFVPGATAAQLDAATGPVSLSGELKPMEAAGLAEQVEAKLTGKLQRRDGKAVYLVCNSNPFASTPGSSATPPAGAQ